MSISEETVFHYLPPARLRDRSSAVLIVDNDEDVLLCMERTLEDHGYATAVAATYSDTLKLLSEKHFDVLVLDDYLSEKDSIEALLGLRSAGTVPEFVIVTYHQRPVQGILNRLRILGVRAFVGKHSPYELTQTVHSLLRRASPSGGMGQNSVEGLSTA